MHKYSIIYLLGQPFGALGWPPKAWPGAQGLVSEGGVAPGYMDAVGPSPVRARQGCQEWTNGCQHEQWFTGEGWDIGEMNTTDSTAILEAIHQGSLAKRGINPQPGRPSRAAQQGRGCGMWGQPPGRLLLSLPMSGRVESAGILRGEFCKDGPSSLGHEDMLHGHWRPAKRPFLREVYLAQILYFIILFF